MADSSKCTECGYVYPAWYKLCPMCGEDNNDRKTPHPDNNKSK